MRLHQEEEIVFQDLGPQSEEDADILEVDLNAKEGERIARHARVSSDEGTPTGDPDDDPGIDYGSFPDDEPGDEGDEEISRDDRYSKNVRGRIGRERRVTRRERARADDAEAENVRLRKQLKKAKSGNKEDAGLEQDRQIKSLEQQLEDAIENGKTKDQVRLSSELLDLKAEKIAAKYVVDDDDDEDDDPPARPPTRTLASENTDDWKDKHSSWYGRPGFERFTRSANALDKEIHAEGYSAEDEDYFEELDGRLKKKFPQLFDEDGEPAQNVSRKSRKAKRSDKRSPVGAADDASRNPRPRSDSSKVIIGKTEQINMRRFGLDPDNPNHVHEYALNKRQTDAEELDRG